MRIRLADEDRGLGGQPAKRKRGKGRRGQTFLSAVPMPQTRARPSGAKRTSLIPSTRQSPRTRTWARMVHLR